ncbi:MAG: hypothetical protein CMH27_01630 [Micavibrio sp.]|nr:hypothetical protein [Micavibrio sp.]
MHRRQFLSAVAACAFVPSSMLLASENVGHPFAALINPDTGRRFEPQGGKFVLALFMSAQESYPNCGASFIGMYQTLSDSEWADHIEPVLIMPKISDQSNPKDIRNLQRAKSFPTPYTILTGDLADIVRASRDVGAFFEFDENGKVSGHTLDAFLLTPAGKMVFHHRADDNFKMVELVDKAVGHCKRHFLGVPICL